jgi:hypothetical protein
VKNLYLLFAAILVVTVAPALAVADTMDITPLSNKDVLLMVERRVPSETIISAIKSSPCTFDTFPSVLKELKRRGVPEEVLQAMLDAPYGPAAEKRSTEDLDEPIYHYTEQIKQYLAPAATGRRYTPSRPTRTRAARTRIRR